MSAPASPRALLRLAAALLAFAASASVAISVVNTRLSKSSPRPDVVIVPSAGTEGTTYVPGPGRLLLVDSTPTGARVSVGGKRVGTTPWSSDWACTDGEAVHVVVEREGSQPHDSVAICQSGTTRIAVTLERAFR
ncbi:MAG: PEGA domain-containing protein [Myxococcales bacterium]|nr:PEGA domain-containing protein [Myxococcales bacterium]